MVDGALMQHALVDADAQRKRVSRKTWQSGAAMLHFAGTKQRGVGRREMNPDEVVAAFLDGAAVRCSDTLDPVQPALNLSKPAGCAAPAETVA